MVKVSVVEFVAVEKEKYSLRKQRGKWKFKKTGCCWTGFIAEGSGPLETCDLWHWCFIVLALSFLQEEEVTMASKASKQSDTLTQRRPLPGPSGGSPPELAEALHSGCWIVSQGYWVSCLGLASSPAVSTFWRAVSIFPSLACRLFSSAPPSTSLRRKQNVRWCESEEMNGGAAQGDPGEDAITHDAIAGLLDPTGCKQRIMDELPKSQEEKKLFLLSMNMKHNVIDCCMMQSRHTSAQPQGLWEVVSPAQKHETNIELICRFCLEMTDYKKLLFHQRQDLNLQN